MQLRAARSCASCARLLVASLVFLLFIHSEEPASQVQRVSRLSANELSDIRERAFEGDADAQVIMGIAYDGGSRVLKKDPSQARRWYEMSAKRGNLDAQFWLLGLDHPGGTGARSSYLRLATLGHVGGMNVYASLCANGTDGPQDFADAMRWWKKASNAGSAEAALNIGTMYLDGEGVAPDEQQAVMWLRRAADGGSIPAAARLGSMALMKKGRLVPGTNSTRWLNVAADAGDPTSMLNLGMVLFHGLGAQPDFVEAYMWFTLAAQRGAIDGRTGLRGKMTEKQIAEAGRRVADWNMKHPQ
jgi:TPR repeat protein